MSNDKIMLFYANWCGHCKTFKPTWEALKPILDKNNISHEEYESENTEVMSKYAIRGYPTIKVQKNNEVVDYNGPRDPASILHFLNVNNTEQSGGAKKNYYNKYLKYKKKYLALKN